MSRREELYGLFFHGTSYLSIPRHFQPCHNSHKDLHCPDSVPLGLYHQYQVHMYCTYPYQTHPPMDIPARLFHGQPSPTPLVLEDDIQLPLYLFSIYNMLRRHENLH